jgi:serine/threonine protein kinase
MNRTCPSCEASLEEALLVNGLCPACVARSMQAGLRGLLDEVSAPEKEAVSIEIEGYEVSELIGGGGMGEVYHARRISDGRQVAVKVVAGRFTRDPEVTARFENEVSAMAQLHHPHVVRILDQGVTRDGRHYLVSEYIDGCDLRRLMKAQRPDTARAFEIFDKVCAGIAHAHDCGIVHRDIKPANILIGGDGTVKVADFGLAKMLVDETRFYGFTQTTDTFGTPYYIAPEVTRKAGLADQRADVYALGVLLYELLTGAVPMGQFTPLSQRAGMDRRMDTIIADALADDPERRTGSVAALAAEVRRIATAQATRRKRSRMTHALAAALVVLGLGGALGAWWATVGRNGTTRPIFASPARASRTTPWKNSLGMSFVPLPAHPLLVCIHETRLRDYIAFNEAENAVLPDWRLGLAHPRQQMRSFAKRSDIVTERDEKASTWDEPGFKQAPDHPVTGVDLVEARLFCAWLTWTERQEGRLTSQQGYRLPRESEWNEIADHDTTVWQREDAAAQANFAGVEAAEVQPWPEGSAHFDRRDPFPRTAPVGSFKPNDLGLHDLFGNVAEWVDTPAPDSVGDGGTVLYGLRGGSWATGQARQARPDFHIGTRPGRAQANFGFRVVLDLAMKKETRSAKAPNSDTP